MTSCLKFTDDHNWKYDLDTCDTTPRFRLPKLETGVMGEVTPRKVTPRDRNKPEQWATSQCKVCDDTLCYYQDTEAEGPGHKFPRIVLKGVVGQELNTDTSYQRAIHEAKWRMSMGQTVEGSQDWRLPHSVLPARPGKMLICMLSQNGSIYRQLGYTARCNLMIF